VQYLIMSPPTVQQSVLHSPVTFRLLRYLTTLFQMCYVTEERSSRNLGKINENTNSIRSISQPEIGTVAFRIQVWTVTATVTCDNRPAFWMLHNGFVPSRSRTPTPQHQIEPRRIKGHKSCTGRPFALGESWAMKSVAFNLLNSQEIEVRVGWLENYLRNNGNTQTCFPLSL
jgi:hypothetical protein